MADERPHIRGDRRRKTRLSQALVSGCWVCFAALLWPGVLANAQSAVFQERFDRNVEAAQAGWVVEAVAEQSEWTVTEGRMRVVCHRNPYKGGRMTHPVPMLERGELSFDVKFATAGATNYGHLSLGFKLYGKMTAFKKYGGHNWMAYDAGAKRWTVLAIGVPLQEWVRIRMVFDAPAKRAEYYWGDREDPVYVDDAFAFPAEPVAELEFFNYGLCAGTVVHELDNIELWRIAATDARAAHARDMVLVFRGLSADRYGIVDMLRGVVARARLAVYTVQTRGAAIAPRNKLALDRVPSRSRLARASHILLVDVPVGPNGCMPAHLVADIADAVRGGAELVVFGGMFAFGKGGYAGTPLADVLPVALGGPWAVKRLEPPRVLQFQPALAFEAGGAVPAPAPVWCHAVAVKPGAAVLVRAGDRPVCVRWRCGEGGVAAWLATVAGRVPDSGSEIAYWEWAGWGTLVRRILESGGVELTAIRGD